MAFKMKGFTPFTKKKGLDGKACWKGFKLDGTKIKGGEEVDNCVPTGKSPLKRLDSVEGRQDIDNVARFRTGVKERSDISNVSRSSRLDNIENKVNELSETISGPKNEAEEVSGGMAGMMGKWKDWKDEGGEGSFNDYLRKNMEKGDDVSKYFD